jgi:hypothetical protein
VSIEDIQRQTTPLYEAALYYANLGWHVIPLKPRSKVAAIKWRKYQTQKPDASELYDWFVNQQVWDEERQRYVTYNEPLNIAGILGDERVQKDFDGLDDGGGFGQHVSDFPSVRDLPRVRTGSGKVHTFFGVRSPIQHHDIALPGGGVIEVRTGRNIAVLPPSIHPNGEPYVWEVPIPKDGLPIIDPATVGVKARPKLTVVGREYHEGDPLSEGEIDVIVEAVAPSWTPNHRHALSLGVSGWLASIGAPEEDARTVVSRLAAGDVERHTEFQRSVRDTYVKAASGIATKGWSELHDSLSQDGLRLLEGIAKAHEPTFTLSAKVKGITIPWAIDLADFLGLDFPPDTWLVDGLIEDIQLGMIAGEPGVQKSWLSLYLALCVALGEPFFGTYYIPERRTVVYIQEENSAKKLNRRISRLLKWMGKTREDIRGWFTLITNQSFRIDKPDVMQRLCDDILTPKQPALVIFDPMVEMHHKKENDNDEMTPLMEALRQIRNHYECVVILVHHCNKATEMENFINRIRGASSITGAVDFGIGLVKRKEEEEKSTVFWWKIRDDKKPSPFVVELIDQDDGSIRFAMYEGGKPKVQTGLTEMDVIEAVEFLGEGSTKAIAEQLGLKTEPKPPDALYTLLNVLAGQKKTLMVDRRRDGNYYSLKDDR